MLQIELIATKDMVELQDMWQRVIDDVDDLVSTVGIAAAEALVEGLLVMTGRCRCDMKMLAEQKLT